MYSLHEGYSHATLEKEMKNIARLILFFSICFVLIFLAAILFRFLDVWIELARLIPVETRLGGDVTDAAWKALPVALYLSILLGLSYTVRRGIRIPVAISCIIALGCFLTIGASLVISRASVLQFSLKSVAPIQGEPGLILSRSENSIVLLNESSDVLGPRVLSFPGRPLMYQETPIGPNNTVLSLPALPFSNESPWFIHSLKIDFSLSARQLESRLDQSFLSFAIYVISLILFLGSTRFILEFSQWPLANLFIGALAFRGILTLETFLNAQEINALIGSFLAGALPPAFISPLVFASLGILIILYTLLARVARSRRGRDD
jgi:hypothetical protein